MFSAGGLQLVGGVGLRVDLDEECSFGSDCDTLPMPGLRGLKIEDGYEVVSPDDPVASAIPEAAAAAAAAAVAAAAAAAAATATRQASPRQFTFELHPQASGLLTATAPPDSRIDAIDGIINQLSAISSDDSIWSDSADDDLNALGGEPGIAWPVAEEGEQEAQMILPESIVACGPLSSDMMHANMLRRRLEMENGMLSAKHANPILDRELFRSLCRDCGLPEEQSGIMAAQFGKVAQRHLQRFGKLTMGPLGSLTLERRWYAKGPRQVGAVKFTPTCKFTETVKKFY